MFPVCHRSNQKHGVHPVRGHDVRLHHRASVLAGGGDDLLLQEDLSGRRGGAEGDRVSDPDPDLDQDLD